MNNSLLDFTNNFYKTAYKNISKNEYTNDKYYKEHLLFLFADLYILAQKIIHTTFDKDIIILIGNTPSYLKFFLEGKRKYCNIASSNKPFACVNYKDDCETKRIFTPNTEQLNSYFKYLSNTILTKTFVKENWDNLVLVDTSSGDSIHGMSLLFNLYAENINIKKDIDCNLDIDCNNIEGVKPLQFINIMADTFKAFNIESNVFDKIKNLNKDGYMINFNPKLLIQINHFGWFYRQCFTLLEFFPRIMPEYSKYSWTKDINKVFDTIDKNSLEEIEKIYKTLLKGLKIIQSNKKIDKVRKRYLDKCNKILINLAKDIPNNKVFITDNFKTSIFNVFTILLHINNFVL